MIVDRKVSEKKMNEDVISVQMYLIDYMVRVIIEAVKK